MIKQLHRYSTFIQPVHIQKYRFLQSFLQEPALFFEDPCYTIIYIKDRDSDTEEEEDLYAFFIDRHRRRYLKGSMPLSNVIRILLLNHFTQYHFVLLYAHLYLFQYEKDMNHDLYDWLKKIPMENIQYILDYQGQEPSFDLFYSF